MNGDNGSERRSGRIGGYTPSPKVDRRKRPWIVPRRERRVTQRPFRGPDRRLPDPWAHVRDRDD
jgi:hypothetical protein